MQVELNLAEMVAEQEQKQKARQVAELKAQLAAEVAALNEEKLNQPEIIDGWVISAKQCILLTLGDREAVDKFFNDNMQRLKNLSISVLYKLKNKPGHIIGLLEIYDLINQVYVDLRSGYLYFDYSQIKANPKIISKLIHRSCRFAGVGGFGDELGQFKPAG